MRRAPLDGMEHVRNLDDFFQSNVYTLGTRGTFVGKPQGARDMID